MGGCLRWVMFHVKRRRSSPQPNFVWPGTPIWRTTNQEVSFVENAKPAYNPVYASGGERSRPPFPFPLAEKEKRPARWKRKRRFARGFCFGKWKCLIRDFCCRAHRCPKLGFDHCRLNPRVTRCCSEHRNASTSTAPARRARKAMLESSSTTTLAASGVKLWLDGILLPKRRGDFQEGTAASEHNRAG